MKPDDVERPNSFDEVSTRLKRLSAEQAQLGDLDLVGQGGVGAVA